MDKLTRQIGKYLEEQLKKYMKGESFSFELNPQVATGYLIYKFLDTKEKEIRWKKTNPLRYKNNNKESEIQYDTKTSHTAFKGEFETNKQKQHQKEME